MERPKHVRGTTFLGLPPLRKPGRAQQRNTPVERDRDSNGPTVPARSMSLFADPFKGRPIALPDQTLWAPILDPSAFAETVATQDGDTNEWATDNGGKPRGQDILVTLPLQEVAPWFEKIRQDFVAVGGAKVSKARVPAFVVNFLGERDPGNMDIKAGSFVVERNPDADTLQVAHAVKKRSRVVLWRFRCAGYDSSHGINCTCRQNKTERMNLYVEIFADDIHNAHISVDHFHDPLPKTASSKLLAPSSVLKLEAWRFFMHGSTPKLFLKHYDNLIKKSGRPMSLSSLLAISRKARRFRLGSASVNVLLALAKDDPYVFASHLKSRTGDANKLGKSFAFMMTDPIGLVDAIRFGLSVSGIDASFRNFTTANAPLTVLVSFDHVTHQIRLLALLFSADTTEQTLESFVTWFQRKIQEFCVQLKDQRDITGDLRHWPAKLQGLEERVLHLAGGNLWEPDVFTMDHADNEYNAIRKTCPSSKIRACFFHFKQQILRWSFAVDPSEEAADQQPCKSVRMLLVSALSGLFQASQSEIEAAETEFMETQIARCVDEGSPRLGTERRSNLIHAIKQRLTRVWFNDRWRQTIYSHHLPDHIATSDVFTNNWAEGTIRSLRSYLGGKCNIVACILQLRRYWSYYRHVDGAPKCNKDQMEAMASGGALWMLGRVAPAAAPGTRFLVARDEANANSALVDLGLPRLHCNVSGCRLREQLLCKHFFAADLFARNGPYGEQFERVHRLGSTVKMNDLGGDGSGVDGTSSEEDDVDGEEDGSEQNEKKDGADVATDEGLDSEEDKPDSDHSDSDNENLDPRINLTTNLPGRPATSKVALAPIRPQSRVPGGQPRSKPPGSPTAGVLPANPVQIKYSVNAATRYLAAEGTVWPTKKSKKRQGSASKATSATYNKKQRS